MTKLDSPFSGSHSHSHSHSRGEERRKRLRVLCIHGFRTSASIFQSQLLRWPPHVLDLLDLTFLDAPFPAEGVSEVQGIFPPPYYEWFRFNLIFTEYRGLDECISYIANYMEKHGPFDGLMGFSQGAVLSAALAGLQQKGLALQRHPQLRFVIIISGALFKSPQVMKDCYSEIIKCPSLHMIGSNDWLKPRNEQVLKVFENPLVLRHGAKHIVPRLGEEMVASLRKFLLRFTEESEDQLKEVLKATNEDSYKEVLQIII